MIKVETSRNGQKKRYEIQFFQGPLNWFVDLDDSTYNDPRLFSQWIQSFVQNLQVKSK